MQPADQPRPITPSERRGRLGPIRKAARLLGFVGAAQYQHAYSKSGGAQYLIGPNPDEDLLIVYAEAFERDADPDDFSLDALLAHECGHQRLVRNRDLKTILAKFPSEPFEEILASLVGSLLLDDVEVAETLVWKATAELSEVGLSAAATTDFIDRLRRLLRHFL